MQPSVTPIFHKPTSTWTYVVADPATREAAVIDPVLDYDWRSARTGTASADEILACKPVYERFDGWSESSAGATDWNQLPAKARRYLERVQEVIGVPIDMVSTGPDRAHTIVLRHPFKN